MRFSVRRATFVVVAVFLLSGLLTGLHQWHARADADSVGHRCAQFAAQRVQRAAVINGTSNASTASNATTASNASSVGDAAEGEDARIVVIGDSWSAGLGLADPAHSWPARLPGRVYVDGFSGSGFSALASPCGPVAYFERATADARRDADLFLVQGGLNDYDQSDAAITDGFTRLMSALSGHRVIVIGPTAAPARAAAVPRVDRLLASLATEAQVPYLSTRDLTLTYQRDRLHPTQAGADAFGDAVADYVAAHPAADSAGGLA